MLGPASPWPRLLSILWQAPLVALRSRASSPSPASLVFAVAITLNHDDIGVSALEQTPLLSIDSLESMTSTHESTLDDTRADSMTDEGGPSTATVDAEPSEVPVHRVMVRSVRWFRLITALAMGAALTGAAILLPPAGRFAAGAVVLLIVSSALALGWTAPRSATVRIADIESRSIAKPR
jgi:hypothetical protein